MPGIIVSNIGLGLYERMRKGTYNVGPPPTALHAAARMRDHKFVGLSLNLFEFRTEITYVA